MCEAIVSRFIILFLLALNYAGNVVGCSAKQNAMPSVSQQGSKKITTMPARGGEETVSEEIKVLAEGSHISVPEPFVVIARDAETYATLRELVTSLPEMNADFFKSNAVVAAFLGQRRTSGYSVDIVRGAGGVIHITEKSPPKKGMVKMVLTTPFKIVSVSLSNAPSLRLEMGQAWHAGARIYRVTIGDFTMSGGITGRMENFQVEGEIQVMRYNKLATFVFALKGKGEKAARALNDVATGVVQPDGRTSIARLEADTMIDLPHSPLQVTGRFVDKENKVTLALNTLPSHIADGYSGMGKLEAIASESPKP